MNCWDTLEIGATNSLSEIKKAYAKKLKTNHPEDNPAGFQILKEAYDTALKLAKSGVENQIIPMDEAYDEYVDIGNYSGALNITSSVFFNTENSEFLSKLDALYSDFFERIKLDNWIKLLNQDIMWDLNNRMKLKQMVIEFFSFHFYLPKEIWKLIDESFNFSNPEDPLLYEYNMEFPEYFFKILKQSVPLNYSFISNVKDNQFDVYIELKDKINNLLDIRDSREAEKTLRIAKEYCENDPDLFRMEGTVNFLIHKFDEAMTFIDKALSINPSDFESLYYRAYICFIKSDFSSALVYLNVILNILPDYNKAALLAAQCHLKLNNLFEANILISSVINSNPDDNSRLLLVNLVNVLNNKLKKRIFLKPWTIKETSKHFIALNPKQKLTFNQFLYKFIKVLKYLLYIILCIGFVAVTKLGAIILIFFITKSLNKGNKNY